MRVRDEDVKRMWESFQGSISVRTAPADVIVHSPMGRGHRGRHNLKAFNKFFVWSGTMVPVLESPSLYHDPEQLQGAP